MDARLARALVDVGQQADNLRHPVGTCRKSGAALWQGCRGPGAPSAAALGMPSFFSPHTRALVPNDHRDLVIFQRVCNRVTLVVSAILVQLLLSLRAYNAFAHIQLSIIPPSWGLGCMSKHKEVPCLATF